MFLYLRPIFRVFLIICRWQWNSSKIPSGFETENHSEKQPASPKGSFATFLSNNWPEDSTSWLSQIQFTVVKSLLFWQSWSSGFLDPVSIFSKMAPPSSTREEFEDTAVNLAFSWSFSILFEYSFASDLHFRILSIACPHF